MTIVIAARISRRKYHVCTEYRLSIIYFS
ncbi:hypothetical protein CP8484711_0410A, partial [Chlamydia psittaci 84-8471/1]